MAHTKRNCDQCGKEYTAKNSRSQYCSDGCRANSRNEKIKAKTAKATTLSGYGLPKAAADLPTISGESANMFLMQARITELMNEKEQLRADLREKTAANEVLKDKLNKKKRELAIGKIEPTGLGGLQIGDIAQMAPHIPQILESLKGMMPGGAPKMGGLPEMDIDTQTKVVKFAQVMAQMPKERAEALWAIVQLAEAGEAEKAKELIINYKQTYGNGTDETAYN